MKIENLSSNLFEKKTIMIYSHYSKNGAVDSYNYYIIDFFSKLVDNIFILSNIHVDKWNLYNNTNNIHILDYDYKMDFANYYKFIMNHKNNLLKINRMFLINDSFLVVDKVVFENKIRDKFFSGKINDNYDGLIGSVEYNHHYQSYFLCIKN